ncbi:MAG: amidohydrolase family protein, partial [Hyphomicrobiales bacterium]|nr:amidohydrolase family protein [Hyphomicrobiales bacterium]
MECAPEMAFTIAESVKSAFKSDVAVSVGLAPHSLRAVDHSGMDQIAKMAKSLSPNAPVHLHVSEQVDEVRQCVAHYGKNPIELLAASTTLDQRWVLVHCTHATEQDFKLIADANACVALCPMTEANLGDGHVNLSAMLTAKCRYGIGSDSQVALAPKVEWLMLEYSQRLLKRERNVASVSGMSVGRTLLEASSQSAEHALGRPTGKFALGYQADMVELEVMDPAFVGIEDDRILDAWIFAADRSVVSNVMVAGDWIVKSGVHRNEQPLRQRYEAALRRLRG